MATDALRSGLGDSGRRPDEGEEMSRSSGCPQTPRRAGPRIYYMAMIWDAAGIEGTLKRQECMLVWAGLMGRMWAAYLGLFLQGSVHFYLTV